MKILRFIVIGLGIAWLPASAVAAFHLMKVDEVLTGVNGDTGIQYVELVMVNSNQNFVGGHHLESRGSTGTVIGDFTIPNNVASGVAGGKILLATQAFADLAIVTPDFILPPNFISPFGGQVKFVGSAFSGGTVSYALYAGTGINGTAILGNDNSDNLSLTRMGDTTNDNADFQSLVNSPLNNANQTGSIPSTTSVQEWTLYD